MTSSLPLSNEHKELYDFINSTTPNVDMTTVQQTDSYKHPIPTEHRGNGNYPRGSERTAIHSQNTCMANEPSKDAPTVTNELGGKQSYIVRAYHLVPPEGLAQIARVLHHGYIKYGRDNWRLIACDEHLNHALNHVYLHLAGNTSEDHLAHAATRMIMALELQTLGDSNHD